MLDQVTIQKLREMRLPTMAEQFALQAEDPSFHDMPFEDRFGLIVDREWATRKSNRLKKLIRASDLHFKDAAVENIEYHADRALDKALITRLSACNYVRDRKNIIVLGASGAGKTYIACALGIAACRNFFSVRYVRLPDLLIELALARQDGTYRKTMNRLKKINLLIIDEWLLIPLDAAASCDLLEIIEARHQIASTILCSQFAPAGWHQKLGEDTLADAILDRIVHDSYTIFAKGDVSMRKRKGLEATETATMP